MADDNRKGFGDRAPTPLSTSSLVQMPPSHRKPSPQTQRIIGELGLRYRPSATADLEAHAATLALLCRDLADVPPHILERAAQEWAVKSPYLPKASDLAGRCQELITPVRVERGESIWVRRMNEGNASIAASGKRDQMRWVLNEDRAGIHLEGARG
jgi:hypothetical protein